MSSVACAIKGCKYNGGQFCKKMVVILTAEGYCAELQHKNMTQPYMEGWTKVAAASYEADKERHSDAAEGHPSRNYQEDKNIEVSKEEEKAEESEKVEEEIKETRKVEDEVKEDNND